MTHAMALAVMLVTVGACAPTPEEGSGAPAATIAGRDWILTSVGDLTEPRGMQDRPATIRFDSAGARAAGFAGCNQFSAGYTLTGDSLAFAPAISTKMLCPEAMELETSFLGALERVTRVQATDSTLTLYGPEGILARFRSADS